MLPSPHSRHPCADFVFAGAGTFAAPKHFRPPKKKLPADVDVPRPKERPASAVASTRAGLVDIHGDRRPDRPRTGGAVFDRRGRSASASAPGLLPAAPPPASAARVVGAGDAASRDGWVDVDEDDGPSESEEEVCAGEADEESASEGAPEEAGERVGGHPLGAAAALSMRSSGGVGGSLGTWSQCCEPEARRAPSAAAHAKAAGPRRDLSRPGSPQHGSPRPGSPRLGAPRHGSPRRSQPQPGSPRATSSSSGCSDAEAPLPWRSRCSQAAPALGGASAAQHDRQAAVFSAESEPSMLELADAGAAAGCSSASATELARAAAAGARGAGAGGAPSACGRTSRDDPVVPFRTVQHPAVPSTASLQPGSSPSDDESTEDDADDELAAAPSCDSSGDDAGVGASACSPHNAADGRMDAAAISRPTRPRPATAPARTRPLSSAAPAKVEREPRVRVAARTSLGADAAKGGEVASGKGGVLVDVRSFEQLFAALWHLGAEMPIADDINAV